MGDYIIDGDISQFGSGLSDKKYECCALKCNVKTGNIKWRKNDQKTPF